MNFLDIQGAIFDVDDTLLSNYPDDSRVGLHELSRLAAAHEVGRRHNSAGLQAFTEQQSIDAFLNAKVHTLQAAVWQMLYMAGEVTTEEIEPAHPLLNEIMALKDELHERTLRTKGREVPGATAFVRTLARRGLKSKMAVASTACRRDIDIFFEMSGLDSVFPPNKIISRECFTHAKPNPEAYNLAFATLGLPQSARPHVAAFEDDPRGIMSAKAAGLFTYAITTRFDRKSLASLEVPPDAVIDTYAELTALLGLNESTPLQTERA